LEKRVAAAKAVTDSIKKEMAKVIVGQHEMVESIVMAMAAGKHVLLEGVPGVAKTEASNAAADSVAGQFQRVQGTPDLLPGDIIGSELMEKDETGKFVRRLMKGPIFTDLLLVDEINRMPQKVQSGLLQAMAEKKVTIGRETFQLPHFTVVATQNPVEQAGTNPLPEAQLDRFMFKVLVDEGGLEETKAIMRLNRSQELKPKAEKVASLEALVEVRRTAESIALDEGVEDYIARVARAPKLSEDIAKNLSYSVGTRASLDLERAARLRAVMEGRAYVSIEDVRAVAPRVLRHRMTLTYDAQAAGLTADKIIQTILETEKLPGDTAFLLKKRKR
jgi:MoxR-like ATPase